MRVRPTSLPDAAAASPTVELGPRTPDVRAEGVVRTALVNRLRAATAPLVTVRAPAGYGKTTLLAQWAARDARPFAWLTVDDGDNDPAVLVRRLALALAQPPTAAVPSIGANGPIVVVFDDAHVLRSRGSLAAVAALAEQVSEGSTLILAGRSVKLAVARARAAGRLYELGAEDLALGRREEELLFRDVGIALDPADHLAVTREMEGWAAGTHLAALAIREGGGRFVASGEDRFVADYFDFECTAGLPATDLRFLTRTAVLERLSGSLCDHVLDTDDSAGRLEALARANLFVFPLDRRRRWYRYHHAFRAYLLVELVRREPQVVPELHRLAAGWCERSGDAAAAAAHAHAAGDLGRLVRLVARSGLATSAGGRSAIGDAWLSWFDDPQLLAKHPGVAALGAWAHLVHGRPAAARRWRDALAAAVRTDVCGVVDDSPAAQLAVLEAAVCANGPERMRADAHRALDGLAALGSWRPLALLLRGVAELLLGARNRAEETLHEASETADGSGATALHAWALAQLGVLAGARGDDGGAEALVREARDIVDEHGLAGDAQSALVLAAAARQHLRKGDTARARVDLERAEALTSQLTTALPWHAVQTSLQLAHASLALVDPATAQSRLDVAAEVLRRRPRLGDLGARVDGLRGEVRALAARRDTQQSGLTTAELRLLPLLATHLSFREIAEQLFVSRNTVKTQAISVYRKLDASSRSEAISRARALGLVDSVAPRVEFILSG